LQLEAQVKKLKTQLEEEREESKRQKKEIEEKLWTHFHEELMRLEKQRTEFEPKSSLDHADGPCSQNVNNTSMRKTHSLTNLETRADLEDHIKKLCFELEQSKKTHSERLMQLQELLFTKQKEMEDFKQKLVDYTKNQFEAKDKQNENYVEALKKEIECLNEELSKNTNLESREAELHKLKCEKKQLKKLLEKAVKQSLQAKEFYEKREDTIIERFKRKEDDYYKILVKLKKEVDTFTLFDWTADDEADIPVKL